MAPKTPGPAAFTPAPLALDASVRNVYAPAAHPSRKAAMADDLDDVAVPDDLDDEDLDLDEGDEPDDLDDESPGATTRTCEDERGRPTRTRTRRRAAATEVVVAVARARRRGGRGGGGGGARRRGRRGQPGRHLEGAAGRRGRARGRRGRRRRRPGRADRAGPAQAARRVRLPVVLLGEAPEPAGRQEADALPGLCLRTRPRGADRPGPGRSRSTRHRALGRSLAQRTLDVVVFGPAGLVLTAVEDLPELAAKGRARFERPAPQRPDRGRVRGEPRPPRVRRRMAADAGPVPPPPGGGPRPTGVRPGPAPRPGARGTPGRRPGRGPSAPAGGAVRAPGAGAPPSVDLVHPRLRHPLGLPGRAAARRPRAAPSSRPSTRTRRPPEARRTILHRAQQLLGTEEAPGARRD